MKSISHSSSIRVSSGVSETTKFTQYFIQPIKAGFFGFATVMMIVFFINLLSYVVGSRMAFGLDFIDLLLAATGFILQMLGAILKIFIR